MSSEQFTTTKNENVFGESNRRAFLKKAMGLACATASTSILSSCNLKSADDFAKGKTISVKGAPLFTEQQMTTLFAIVDTVLPRTDTPSASDVNCHNFIAHQLRACHTADEQNACVNIVQQIDTTSIELQQKPFALLDTNSQQSVLNQLEQQQGFSAQEKGQFGFLKALIVFGYFTSEVGATQALNYQGVPGGFKGSIPSDASTKSWGSIDFY